MVVFRLETAFIGLAILPFLPPNVIPNLGLIMAHGRNRIATSPKTLSIEVLLPSRVLTGYRNGTLAFDIPDDLSDGMLGRNTQAHVHVITGHVSLHYRAAPLPGQLVENGLQIFANLAI